MGVPVQKGMQGRKTTTEALVDEIRRHAEVIDKHPCGRVELDWQDGRPVLLEVTIKHKPALRS